MVADAAALILSKAAAVDSTLVLSESLLNPKSMTGARYRLRHLRSEHRLSRWGAFDTSLQVIFNATIDERGALPLKLLPRPFDFPINICRSNDAARPDGTYNIVGVLDGKVELLPVSRRGRSVTASLVFILAHRDMRCQEATLVDTPMLPRNYRAEAHDLKAANAELILRLQNMEAENTALIATNQEVCACTIMYTFSL